MERKRLKDLNDRQRSWLTHLKKSAVSEMSPRDYAKTHDLNYSTLEKMRIRLGKMKVWSEPEKKPHAASLFEKMSISSPSPQYTQIDLTLPNGVMVRIAGGLGPGSLDEILNMAARIR